eukprot:GHVP01048503.1.p1 GENE.GHVP01048503.1~~GHVP01048503.1.p1  ORF type:complete len:317 (+),score=64.90 GHVP01048503.1:2-952(+)
MEIVNMICTMMIPVFLGRACANEDGLVQRAGTKEKKNDKTGSEEYIECINNNNNEIYFNVSKGRGMDEMNKIIPSWKILEAILKYNGESLEENSEKDVAVSDKAPEMYVKQEGIRDEKARHQDKAVNKRIYPQVVHKGIEKQGRATNKAKETPKVNQANKTKPKEGAAVNQTTKRKPKEGAAVSQANKKGHKKAPVVNQANKRKVNEVPEVNKAIKNKPKEVPEVNSMSLNKNYATNKAKNTPEVNPVSIGKADTANKVVEGKIEAAENLNTSSEYLSEETTVEKTIAFIEDFYKNKEKRMEEFKGKSIEEFFVQF